MNAVGIVFILIALAMLVGFAGFIFLIVFIIRKTTKPKTKEEKASEQQRMQEKVRGMKADLTPWEGHTHEDITSAMMYKYIKGFSNKLSGKIYSPNRKPVVAFDRVERGMAANGYMFASTTDVDLYYEINVDQFKIKYNGEYLGQIQSSGNILNAKGETIGHAKHPKKASFSVEVFHFRSGKNQFPLTMNGRQLATIWVAPNYSDRTHVSMSLIFNENNYGQPILSMHDMPTEEEKKWLLALAILETAFHGHWMI